MTSIYEMFPKSGKYVGTAELGSRKVAVTISHVKKELVGQTREEKVIVYFRDAKKGLVLNATKREAIVEIAGTAEVEAWAGVRIVLEASETEYKGKLVPCIEVSAPQKSKPEPEPELEPEPEPEPELSDELDACPF